MTLSRRGFINTVGVGGLALSCLKTTRLLAQSAPLPKRFVFVFTPNGTIPANWGADGSRTDFTLRRILEPLEPFKSQLNVLHGVNMKSATTGPGDDHQKGMGSLLTGVDLLPGDIKGGCDSCPPASFASGISVDQAIANEIGKTTRFRSLELGVLVNGGENTWNRMCHAGSGQPLPPESDPTRVFDRVFGDLGQDPLGLARRRALKKSVLDFVRSDFAALRTRMGREDIAKLDLHETALRDIEERLNNPGSLGATCKAPGKPAQLDARANDNAPALGKLQMDLITMAFACDLTRVASLQWTNSVGQLSFPWLGFTDRHHDLSHDGDGNVETERKLTEMNRWYAEQFAYLLEQLNAIPEGDGTMLDNTVVVWGNELAKGNAHSHTGVPFVLAGKGGGSLRTGQLLDYAGRPHNDLLLTLCKAMGLSLDRFGNPNIAQAPMSELLV